MDGRARGGGQLLLHVCVFAPLVKCVARSAAYIQTATDRHYVAVTHTRMHVGAHRHRRSHTEGLREQGEKEHL